MVERVKIGLLFSYNEHWIGGTYYVLNLIRALNTLEDKEKPFLVIFSMNAKDFKRVMPIGYPYIRYEEIKIEKPSVPARAVNKISRMLFKENFFKVKPYKGQVSLLFRGSTSEYFRKIPHHLFWIPDFQEDHLPEFFSEGEIVNRKKGQQVMVDGKNDILFSSHDAHGDFKRLYPSHEGKAFVMNFAVTHPDYQGLDIGGLLQKHDLKQPYFFTANQFWKHKNHIVVLETLKELKSKGLLDFMFAFSGKESDYRNPDFFASLKQFVRKNDLEKNVRFLGFIDRSEQLKLMSEAEAVVQPSLFEGWSTVVEDAKAMNQHVIASSLGVHKEQLSDKGYYFDPHDKEALGKLLLQFRKKRGPAPDFNYEEKIRLFGAQFRTIADQILKS